MADDITRVTRTAALSAMPAEKYGDFDSDVSVLRRLRETDPDEVARRLDVDPESVRLAMEMDDGEWSRASIRILRERPELLSDLRRIYVNHLLVGEAVLNVTEVVPAEAILSDTPFTLQVQYANAADATVEVVSVSVSWAGEPFVVQQEVGSQEREATLEVAFDQERTLPTGPAEFLVTLYRADGAQASFRRSVYVLPANPLAVSLGPAGARVSGSWSIRGDYLPGSDTFRTECELTVANGDASAVSMNRRVSWQFWDGAIGAGTLVESGAFDWPGAITVPAHGVWRGSISFSSPRGSGIFNRYDRKEDMALRVTLSAADGRVVQGDITARVQLAYGVNIIKVGTFGAQEHVDLYDAVDRMRQIYEARDITLRGVDRRLISAAAAGSSTVINDENEFRDLLEDWSVSNDFIDVYVVQDFAWSTFNGFAGDTPGPASKGGRKDGVAVDKSGFTDASGAARLPVTTLAQLIGHEVGHYLGLRTWRTPTT